MFRNQAVYQKVSNQLNLQATKRNFGNGKHCQIFGLGKGLFYQTWISVIEATLIGCTFIFLLTVWPTKHAWQICSPYVIKESLKNWFSSLLGRIFARYRSTMDAVKLCSLKICQQVDQWDHRSSCCCTWKWKLRVHLDSNWKNQNDSDQRRSSRPNHGNKCLICRSSNNKRSRCTLHWFSGFYWTKRRSWNDSKQNRRESLRSRRHYSIRKRNTRRSFISNFTSRLAPTFRSHRLPNIHQNGQ